MRGTLTRWLMIGLLGTAAGCTYTAPPSIQRQALNDAGATRIALDAVQRQSPTPRMLIVIELVKSNGTYQALVHDRTPNSADSDHAVLIRDDGRVLVLPPEGSF